MIPSTLSTWGACANPIVLSSSPQVAVPPRILSPMKYVIPAHSTHPSSAETSRVTIPPTPPRAPPIADAIAPSATTTAACPVAEVSASTSSYVATSRSAAPFIRSVIDRIPCSCKKSVRRPRAGIAEIESVPQPRVAPYASSPVDVTSGASVASRRGRVKQEERRAPRRRRGTGLSRSRRYDARTALTSAEQSPISRRALHRHPPTE
jgi:hypothetical protein